MNECGKGKCASPWSILGAAIGIIVGIIVGILFAQGLIPIAISFIIVALVVSIVSLIVLLGTLIAGNLIKCYNPFKSTICKYGRLFLVGTIGTLVSTTITVTVGLALLPVISTIFVAISAFFFTLLLVALTAVFADVIDNTNRDFNSTGC